MILSADPAEPQWRLTFFPASNRRKARTAKTIVSESGSPLDANVLEVSDKPRCRPAYSRQPVSQIPKIDSVDWRNCDPPVTGLSQVPTIFGA